MYQFPVYWTDKLKVDFLQRVILIHSYLYYEVNNIKDVNGIMFLNIDHVGKYFSHRTIDCCPECMKKLKNL